MIAFPLLPSGEINLFLLSSICLGAGILSGFAGVGGAFIVVTALIILGFPANFAVGTTLAWVMGNSVVGAIRHGRLGNVDIQLGLITTIAAIGGVEMGVRMLNWAEELDLTDEVVLSISICMLLTVGIYALAECFKKKRQLDSMLINSVRNRTDVIATLWAQKLQGINILPKLNLVKSGIALSLWIVLAIGFFVGIIIGILGVGGGFVMVPVLVYLIGLSSHMAVGTSLFQIVFSAAYGVVRHTMSGNVIIFASVIMLIPSSIGVQFGVLVTRYVHGLSIRFVLAAVILMSAVAAILKLLSIILGQDAGWFGTGSLVVIFGGTGLAVMVIVALFIMAIRFRRGQRIPTWLKPLFTEV